MNPVSGPDGPAASAELWAATFSSCPVAGCILGVDGAVTEWNQAAVDLFGFEASEALGCLLADLIAPPPLIKSGMPGWRYVALSEWEALGGPLRLVAAHRDGSTVGVEFLPLPFADGRTLVWVTRAADNPPEEPSPDLFRQIFDRAPEVITILDPDRRQRTVNPAGRRLLGLDPGMEQVGDGMAYVHHDDVSGFVDRRQRRDAGEDMSEEALTYRVAHADGSWRWIESLTVDLCDVPPLSGYLVLTRDVTEVQEQRVALEEATARLRAFVRTLRAPALLTDSAGSVVIANDAAAQLCSAASGEALVGTVRPLDTALGRLAIDPDAATRELDRIQSGGRAVSEVPVRLIDGRHLEIDMVPVRSETGSDLGTFWIVRDTTEREHKVERRARLLEMEQIARTAAEASVRELEAFDRYRHQIVSSVSHELRTPLASILSAAEHLGGRNDVDDDLRTYSAVIQRNATRLDALVGDLLVVGRLQAGSLPMEFGPVDLPALVTQVATSHTTSGTPIRVNAGDGPPAGGDELRLSQVIENLVGNALKFGVEDNSVTIDVEHNERQWVVTVADRGVGIDPADRSRVFDPFYRAPRTESIAPGSGLGLVIARGIVEAHGGTIDVHARTHGGTAATFTVPDWRSSDG